MKIEQLKMYPFSTTLLGVLKGALDYYGREMSPAMAFGGSGHAFLINIHEVICPSGPYCWNYDGFNRLVRNLGIEFTDLGFFHPGSTPDERGQVEARLRKELDAGQVCAFCNMENQLITGYDDTGFLLARPWDCGPELTPERLTFGSWQEFGKEVHVNFYVLRPVPRADDAKLARDSLAYAVELFRSPEKYSQKGYGIGPRAYDNWLKAVEAGHGDSHGNWWNAQVWSECRAMAADYFAEGATQSRGELAARSTELSRDYKEIAALLSRAGDKEMPAEEKLGILRDLKAREESAIRKVEALLELFTAAR